MSERHTINGAIDTSIRKPHEGPAVEPYYDKVHQAAWLTRTSGLWAGVGVAGGLGAVIGGAASFLPYVFADAAIPGLAAIGTTAALGAGFGGAMGMVIFPDVAVTSAAVAAGFEEKERREKLEKLRGENPELAAEMERKAERSVPALGERPPLLKRMWNVVVGEYNAKVGVTGAVLGAGFGAMLAMNPATATGLLVPLGLAAGSAPAVAAGAVIVGMVGMCFGLKMSAISNMVTNFAHEVLSGRIFRGEEAPSPAPAIPQQAIDKPKDISMQETVVMTAEPAKTEKLVSYQELVVKQLSESTPGLPLR